ncbi:uncharacterized protein [Chelonus insularis]|uniref:uncharacterized protein n=1 Tax=Chelonus insularis TaxID=460826 RepID=UPI00158E0B0B|nr:uncharacterized protein LOC118070741 [Chelonus insularis]
MVRPIYASDDLVFLEEGLIGFFVYDEIDFKARFRLLKKSVFEVYKIVESMLRHNTERNNAVPPMIQLLLGIRFLSTGSFIITMRDFHGVSKMAAYAFIHRVKMMLYCSRNGKGFYSINVPIMVNSRPQILDIVASWPGSCHDATILDFSNIKTRFSAESTVEAIVALAVLCNICRINEPSPAVNNPIYGVIPEIENNILLHADERQYLSDYYYRR